MRADLDKQITTLTGERDALNARLTSIPIDQGVLTVATKRGLCPTAIPDITARPRSVFWLVNGVPQTPAYLVRTLCSKGDFSRESSE